MAEEAAVEQELTAKERLARQRQEIAEDMVVGLDRLKEFVRDNPEYARMLSSELSEILVFPHHYTADDEETVAVARAMWRAARRASGMATVKSYSDSHLRGIGRFSQNVGLRVLVGRELVCEKVQVGTEQVKKEIPNPAAAEILAERGIEPMVTETVDEPVYEWKCGPID